MKKRRPVAPKVIGLIRTLRKSNSKEYWSILDAGKPLGKLRNVPIETFVEYFKKLSQKSTEICTSDDKQFDPRCITSPINEHINGFFFTLEEIQRIIKRVKDKKQVLLITS